MTQTLRRRLSRLEERDPLNWLSPSDLQRMSLDELRALRDAREKAQTIALIESMARDPRWQLENAIRAAEDREREAAKKTKTP